MQNVVNELKREPVGIDHIRRACPNAKVMMYDKIPPRATYDNLTRGKKSLIVLYTMHSRGKSSDGTGHYALIQKEGTKLLYFSSYGLGPEDEIAATHSSGKIRALLGKNFMRNTMRLQTKGFHTATCGRWCILKARLHDVQMRVFNRIFGQKKTVLDPDSVACIATMFLVG